MVELSLIPKLSLENHRKFESCVESKKLVEETSRRMRLMPITELKSGGNPTY